jgi:uncharacterized protein with NRDE domain
MCLIAFALHAHQDWPLILAANRDEFHDRPSLSAHWWEDHPDIYGGRDLSARGTWLGLSRRGRLAALTNYRESRAEPTTAQAQAQPRSRGELLRAFLGSAENSERWSQARSRELDDYAGFNALLFDWAGAGSVRAHYLSNRHPRAPLHPLAPGIHGLSNHLLGTRWPKVDRLCAVLTEAISRSPGRIETILFDALSDREPIAAHELDRADPVSGTEVLQRTPFVADGRYGTRASTVVMLRADGRLRFIERSWDWHQGSPRQVAERVLELPG